MPKDSHGIVLDEKAQEQPKDKERARQGDEADVPEGLVRPRQGPLDPKTGRK